MKYSVSVSPQFKKQFKKLDIYTQKIIVDWINNNLVNCSNPRLHGKALKGNFAGKWRYRVGKYRLITMIQDSKLIILMLNVGIRNEIYK